MFEQTTPQSECCSESVQALYLGGGHHLSGRIEQEYARTAKNHRFCLFVKVEDRQVQRLAIRSVLELSWPFNLFQRCIKKNTPHLATQEQKCACFQTCSSTVNIFSSGHEHAHWPLCPTGVVAPREATEAIPSSNVTRVWSRHRNPLALKKLPPSLCLTSNGAFFSSLSFFMFVCKVLYITWIYYAHILPNG